MSCTKLRHYPWLAFYSSHETVCEVLPGAFNLPYVTINMSTLQILVVGIWFCSDMAGVLDEYQLRDKH